MTRRRPCRICRRWFTPHARSGDRQRVCGAAACQRERHRRSCAAWHRAHHDLTHEDRLKRRLRPRPGPMSRAAARDAVGLEVLVVVEEASKDLRAEVRDAVRRHVFTVTPVTARVPLRGP